jgi:hypothetical protein
MSYREYFNIDPEYFPQVDKRIIEDQPDLWKKFYPHPSFVQLLKAMVDVLERKQKLSVWVDGAYGTGKSHAVFTLKKLIDASEQETVDYFQHYGLDNLLCKKLIAQKQEGKILVCHRYGSSDIQSDTDLIVAIQEGIEKALREAGNENTANTSLKNSLIRYFENEENQQSFDIYANGTYKTALGGDTSATILNKLQTYEEEALRTLISKIFKVPAVRGGFSMNTEELCDWIREIIEKNSLKELVFIWDEFSEYFENNMHHLTGFQQVAELAATAPFCLLIVTHKAEGYFSEGDPDKKKIMDRFVTPIHIWLPENIAFELMGQAMKVTDDKDKAATWEKHKTSLDRRTMQSRTVVKNKINLSDGDLSNVLPIHPFAALILQHISIYYTSTARSMFNFIKNDEGDDVHAFQWFIDNYDSKSPNPFVTVDRLWSFFYETGSQKLASGIRDVLSCYTPKLDKELLEDEKRVLKVILLLQAVSERMTGNRDVFLPNNKNLTLAFEGTDLEFSASKIAAKLLNDHVVTRTPLTGDVFSYCCKNTGPIVDITQFIPQAKAKSTKDMTFMTGSNLRNIFELTGVLKLRYSLAYATLSDFDSEIKKANNPSETSNKLYAVATIGRDSAESGAVKKKIENFFENNPASNAIVIDSSDCVLGEGEYDEFVENYAMSLAIGSSDLEQRKTYEGYAIEVLSNWAKRIKNGAFYVYSRYTPEGERVANMADLFVKLMDINKFHYPQCLEGAFTSVLNTMYDANSLGAGATCGITEETKGTFRSGNEATKLENALKGAWKVPEYWKTTHSYISSLKKAVDEFIDEAFSKGDRITIGSIYEMLKAEPYGFMPCNLTAFILGFVLKEYANSIYSYSDNLTTVPLDTDKLASMISEIIKQENTPDKRYKDKYIVTLTEAERAFNKATSIAFDIPEMYCVSITETRSRIREQMKSFSFPIWVIKYVLDGNTFTTSKEVVARLIDNYCGIANNKNMEGEKSDSDIALAIGELCLANAGAEQDLKSVLTKDNCKSGMLEYLKVYRDGMLPSIAAKIRDDGQYINQLQYKFSSDAANWVWNTDTVNAKIDELICEYEIVEISNMILPKNTTYIDTIRAWVDKLGQIRVAFSVIKNELGDSKAFFEMLSNLYKQRSLLDSQKPTFLGLLRENTETFRQFMGSQSTLFMKAFSYYLDDLTEDDVKAILEDDAYGFGSTYLLEPDKYTAKVQKAIAEYKNGQKFTQLRKLWKSMTDTDSPYNWSMKYNMPILAMVPDGEIATARSAFAIINSKSKDEDSIKTAQDYVSKMSYAEKLKSAKARDQAFREVFLQEYSVLFDDVDAVKEYLKDHVSDAPYHWIGSTEVSARIKTMANANYMKTGYGKAKKVIDEMPADQVKEYLKKLIEDNIVVGVEIMKGHK